MRIDLAGKILSRSRLERWWNSPGAFADDCVPGFTPAPYQREVIDAIPRRKRVAVRGPHGLGKTAMASLVVNWFAITRELRGIEWKIITTASAWRHLEVYLWPEIHKLARGIDFAAVGREPYKPGSELLERNLKLRHGAATPVASNQPERIEGAHARELLYLLDEAKIIPPATWDSIEGAFSNAGPDTADNAYAFAISTPGPPSGRFYDIHKRAPGYEDWWPRHVTIDEAIAAGRISRNWADQRKLQWGADSAIYHNRVLGEFHASDEDAVIPLAWLEAAIERWHVWDKAGRPDQGGPYWVGVDVGRGGDETVLAHRDGPAAWLQGHRHRDTMGTVGMLQGLDARPIIDVIGVGAGVYDRAREVGLKAVAYVGSGKAPTRDRSRQYGMYNCLTGDVPVRPIGELRKVYRTRYEGPLFEVETARGDHFTATANHQVMTDRGWVAVQSLHVGDQLVDPLGSNSAVRAGLTRPEVNDVPSQIGQIYRAASHLFGSERVRGGAVNFHGDRPVGDVDVVSIDRDLLSIYESRGEATDHVDLIRSLVAEGSFTGPGDFDQGVVVGGRDAGVGTVLPDHGVTGRLGASLVDGHPVSTQVVSGQRVPDVHPLISQDPADDVPVYPIGSGQGESRFTSSVSADHILNRDPKRSAKTDDVTLPPQRDVVLPEDPADHMLVQAHVNAQPVDRLPLLVPVDDRTGVDLLRDGETERGDARSDLHARVDQHAVQGLPVRPDVLADGPQTFPGAVTPDHVIRVELTASTSHDGPYVYTLETSTGTYKTEYTTHKNCRSAAYWNLRELLDPSYDSKIMLPPDDLMISDLTTPTWTITTGVPPKIQVETKDKVVERLGRSPDRGDAVVMSFWAERSAGSGTFAAPVGRMVVGKPFG